MRQLIDRPWVGPVLVFMILLPIYLLTNTDEFPQNRDTTASAIPAWRIATHGDLDVTDFKEPWLTATREDGLRQDWYVDTGDRLTSNRPPGAIFWAVPFYWLSGADSDQMTLPPASVAASVAVALAAAVLAAVFAAIVDRWLAFWSALLVGLTTPLWGVAADALWQHSVSVLWLALGLLFLSRSRLAVAGLMGGLAIFTRPLLGVAPAVWGTYLAIKERSWKPLFGVGITSSIGLGLLFWYYQLAYTSTAVTGGYGSYPVEGLVGRPAWSYLVNIWNVMFSTYRGIFIYTPFLLVLVPGLRSAWKAAAPWVRAGALSGLIYMLAQLRVNDFSGGGAWLGYRLPLEMLVLAAPLLLLSYVHWVRHAKIRLWAFWAGAVASGTFQVYAAIYWGVINTDL